MVLVFISFTLYSASLYRTNSPQYYRDHSSSIWQVYIVIGDLRWITGVFRGISEYFVVATDDSVVNESFLQSIVTCVIFEGLYSRIF